MPATAHSEQSEERSDGRPAETGPGQGCLNGPQQSEAGMLSIVVDGRTADISLICLTISSLLRGTAQRSRMQVLLPTDADQSWFSTWIAHERQISLINSLDAVTPGDSCVMILPAGVVVGMFSLEAAVECLDVSAANVLRILVDGCPGSVELWRTKALGDRQLRAAAEQKTRRSGAERWVSGASVGMYAAGRPEPKMFLRKGRAGKFEVKVLVRDTARPDVRREYEVRIRELEAQLARAKREALSSAHGPARGGRLLLRAMKKGPRYVMNRASRRLLLRIPGRH